MVWMDKEVKGWKGLRMDLKIDFTGYPNIGY